MAMGKMEIKGKGVPTNVLKESFTTLDSYKSAVYSNEEAKAKFRQFRSIDHVVRHCGVSKVALSADNDKVFQVSPYHSRPLGHWRDKEPVQPCPQWDLEDSGDEAVPLAREMIAKSQIPVARESEDDIAEVSGSEEE